MNDEQMQSLLQAWYAEREVAPRDVREGVASVMANVPRTRQQGRWWPLPSLLRKTQTATATDTIEYQPRPTPPSNGHIPTVIGRTQTMFSPVKAITAGALVFALGGVLLIAQPFSQQGSVPGAEQGVEPPVAVEVTEALGLGECKEQTETSFVCEVLHEWSDPRLQGMSLAREINSSIELPDGGELAVFNNIYNIETEDGAWRMRPQLRFEFEGSPELQEGPWWWVLDGDGTYEGLSLLLIRDRREGGDEPLYGYIVSTDRLPPAPEGASTK